MDNKLDNKAAGAALRPHQGAATAGDGPAASTKISGCQHFGLRGRQKCVCSLHEMLGWLCKTPKWQDQGSSPSNNGIKTKEEANFEVSRKADKGVGRSATQPQWPRLTNRTERSGTSVKRPEGPRTTSLMRTTIRTKTMAWMMRSTCRACCHCRRGTYLTTMQGTTTCCERHRNWIEQGCQHSSRQECQLCNDVVSQRRDWADARAMRAMTPARGKRRQRDAGSGASARAKTSAQRGRQRQCNNGDITNAMLARTPVQRRQKRQLSNDDVSRAASPVGRSQCD
jgi:hypothetical protein